MQPGRVTLVETLSIMDICAALFLNEAALDSLNPKSPDRDRIYFSAGHKAPALYVALAFAGFFPKDEVVTLRKLHSPFQGHPHAESLRGLEASSGSLGQGLGIAAGSALSGKMGDSQYRVYCIMGDGEQQEGSIWESVMFASHHKLDNLCAIIDKNQLQIDGFVSNVLNIDPVADKYKAFGWNVIEIDGHDMVQILESFRLARECKGRPTVIIANTIKGKGVSFMENQAGWHGVATKSTDQLFAALRETGSTEFAELKAIELLEYAAAFGSEHAGLVASEKPVFPKDYSWNAGTDMKVEMEPTRFGFGRGLAKAGEDERVVTIHADISDSIKITDFEKGFPERSNRVISVGIAEQNMMQVAAGLAIEGKIPVTGTYGVFAAGRCWDQIRTTICYDNLNVKIAGAHAGISVGADGATHQALEEISLMNVLPNMNLLVPCDSLETERLTKVALLEVAGPVYIRFAREATPVVTDPESPLEFGKANVIRYRKRADAFADAFETILAENYKSENEEISIITCGPLTPEAMRAAFILKEEHNVESRVINLHTIKPLDRASVERAMNETGAILTCEEHQTGGFGNIVAGVVMQSRKKGDCGVFDMVGVADRFGESGDPWLLLYEFGLSAEHIAEKALETLRRKREL
jgi:transketolase